MALNIYDAKYFPELETLRDDYIIDAFSNAETTMNSNGCPSCAFLELKFQGGKIVRAWDATQVSILSAAERLRLFPQLNGLFKLGMDNLFYP